MVAILGDDIRVQSRDGGARELVLYVTPESDPATEAVGAVLLTVTLPQGYPAGAAAQVAVSSTAGHEFAHRLDDPWPLSSEHAAELSAVVAAATHGRPGEQVVWDCVDGVRQWLEVHTLTAKPSAPSDEVSRLNSRLDDAEISEDDLALDEEDMDEEMIEALREVLRGGGKLVRMLDEAEAMKAGSRAQKAALHAIWLGLSDAQRKEMVADSGDDGGLRTARVPYGVVALRSGGLPSPAATISRLLCRRRRGRRQRRQRRRGRRTRRRRRRRRRRRPQRPTRPKRPQAARSDSACGAAHLPAWTHALRRGLEA